MVQQPTVFLRPKSADRYSCSELHGTVPWHSIKSPHRRKSSQGLNFRKTKNYFSENFEKISSFSVHIYQVMCIIHRTRRLEQQ